jgi:hypothetical protein
VIRSHKSKDRKHNGQKKKDTWTNVDIPSITQKTKDRTTGNLNKKRGKLRCSGRVHM